MRPAKTECTQMSQHFANWSTHVTDTSLQRLSQIFNQRVVGSARPSRRETPQFAPLARDGLALVHEPRHGPWREKTQLHFCAAYQNESRGRAGGTDYLNSITP